MKKKLLCLAMIVLMVVGMVTNVSAEDFEGSKDWSVSFNGDKMNSNFKSSEMTEEILMIQPGDSITLQVKVRNDSTFSTDWYMTNEVLRTLEESVTVAEGGAYTYILTYIDKSGTETLLYSSEVVGGEEDTTLEGEGLHQATNSLEDYFFLDRLKSGEGGRVELFVKLDGETQGNDYQNTLARLQMNFAVEKVAASGSTTTVVRNNVRTGDTTQLALFSILTLASGVVLLVAATKMMKKSRSKKGE